MTGWFQDPLNVRRGIFLLLAVVIVGTMLLPMKSTPPEFNPETRDFFQALDKLQPGDPVLISCDFDAGSKAELAPACRAILRHAYRKKLRVVTLGLWPGGIGLVGQIIQSEAEVARTRSPSADPAAAYPVYGRDYVFLGWQPGEFALIVRMTEGIRGAFPQEFFERRDTDSLPIWQNPDGRRINTLGDFKLVVTISAGNPGIDEWIQYGKPRQDFPLGAAVTAVSAPGRRPFYASGQIVGMIAGMRGSAEYEHAVNRTEDAAQHGAAPPRLDQALQGMNALSAGHFLIIALVVVSNVLYFRQSRRRNR